MTTSKNDPLADWFALLQKRATSYDIPDVTYQYPITNLSQGDYSNPVKQVEDLRHYMADSGADAGGTDTLVYTVPAGYVYIVNQLFKPLDQLLTHVCHVRFQTSAGQVFFQVNRNGVMYDPTNYLLEPLRLLAGDQIRFYYQTADPAGSCAYFLVGQIELASNLIKLN